MKAWLAAWISFISNVLLMGIKLLVGFLFQSQSLIADGFHNAADVMASGASLASMKISKRPADKEHPYGHGKAEVIATVIVAFILGFLSLYMIAESIEAFFHPKIKAEGIVFLAGVISLVWKQILYVYTYRIGKQTSSKGLIATAYDHLSDVYASIAIVIGVGFSYIGEKWGVPWAHFGDPLAGVVVSIIILVLAYQMAREGLDILMERNVSDEQLALYEQEILKIPGVKQVNQIRAREHGHYVLVDLRVSVPGSLTVAEGHEIGRQIKKQLMDSFQEIEDVFVHINPWPRSRQ